jgi:hypothetical protein
MMSVELSVEWELAGETEILGKNLLHCHFVHHKSHMTWPGLEPGRRGGKPATNPLSYGTALRHNKSAINLHSASIRHRGGEWVK